MYADAAAHARISARSVRLDFPARDSPSASSVNTIISRSSSSASMMLAASWWRAAKTYGVLGGERHVQRAAADQRPAATPATAISTDPGGRSAPASRRTLVTARSPLAWAISKGRGRAGCQRPQHRDLRRDSCPAAWTIKSSRSAVRKQTADAAADPAADVGVEPGAPGAAQQRGRAAVYDRGR